MLVASASGAATQEISPAAVEARLAQLRSAGGIAVSGTRLRWSSTINEFYRERGFRPLWTDQRFAGDLVAAVEEAPRDGLDPEHYHLGVLVSARSSGPASAAQAVDLELLRTDALLRLAHDLRFGRANPDHPWDADGDWGEAAAVYRAVAAAAVSGRLAAELESLRPSHFVYTGLVDALEALRRVQAQGGWEMVPIGPSLREGDRDPRVVALRRRLSLDVGGPFWAERGASVGSPAVNFGGQNVELFDEALAAAVRSFQHRHGLNEDGIVGPATLAQLNTPVERRIDQVRINLERARWVTHDLPAAFIAVNIAGARVYFVRDGAVIFESRAVVGQTTTRTPVFQAEMQYIDLNPTWTVPSGIVGEVLADIRRDPTYLQRTGMTVIDRQGRPVDVTAAELAQYTARTFPYVFRQRPGPANPLGQIKFVFPNPYDVYLHDTPSRTLFEREQRTFSHGCIRVQNPIQLAELILDDPERWSREDILAAIAEGRTRTIQLERRLPVLILYWTASADLHGELHFYNDTYGRDDALLRALSE